MERITNVSRKNKINIPIVKNGKDICRLIFTRDENMPGYYDLKINFQKNLFEVWSYRLFARCPIVWHMDDTENISMSYHHGAGERPIMIHLKDETMRGADAYRTLPVKNILAPGTDSMFPLPLCKLEIPDNVVNQAEEYHAKGYHHVVDTGEMNVLEFYMVDDSFDLDSFWSMKYSTIWMCQMGMSLEYFSSFTVLSDYEKNAHFMPEHGQVEDRLVAISGLQGMKIMVCKYRVPEINENWDRLHMTFIENKYAEDMLMCTIIRYPKINLRPNEYDGIYMGSANLDQLKPPPGPLAKLPVLPESCVSMDLARSHFSDQERSVLEWRAGLARANLYRELSKHDTFMHTQGEEYRRLAYEFRTAWSTLAEAGWTANTLELQMLFARYLNLWEYRLLSLPFCRDSDPDGLINHVWLQIDDYFEIDIVRDELNQYLHDRGAKQIPVVVSRSRLYAQDDPWDGMRYRLETNGYIVHGIRYKRIEKADMRAFFSMKNGYFDNLYEKISQQMK